MTRDLPKKGLPSGGRDRYQIQRTLYQDCPAGKVDEVTEFKGEKERKRAN